MKIVGRRSSCENCLVDSLIECCSSSSSSVLCLSKAIKEMSQKSATAKDGNRGASTGSGSKSKSVLLTRQANKKVVTEDDLISKKDPITPEDVLGLETATSGEFCSNKNP